MSADGFKATDIWTASIFAYLGWQLYRVEILNYDETEFYFSGPSLDAAAYLEEYHSPDGLACSNMKEYGFAFARLSKKQNELRKQGLNTWYSPGWLTAQGAKIVAAREGRIA